MPTLTTHPSHLPTPCITDMDTGSPEPGDAAQGGATNNNRRAAQPSALQSVSAGNAGADDSNSEAREEHGEDVEDDDPKLTAMFELIKNLALDERGKLLYDILPESEDVTSAELIASTHENGIPPNTVRFQAVSNEEDGTVQTYNESTQDTIVVVLANQLDNLGFQGAQIAFPERRGRARLIDVTHSDTARLAKANLRLWDSELHFFMKGLSLPPSLRLIWFINLPSNAVDNKNHIIRDLQSKLREHNCKLERLYAVYRNVNTGGEHRENFKGKFLALVRLLDPSSALPGYARFHSIQMDAYLKFNGRPKWCEFCTYRARSFHKQADCEVKRQRGRALRQIPRMSTLIEGVPVIRPAYIRGNSSTPSICGSQGPASNHSLSRQNSVPPRDGGAEMESDQPTTSPKRPQSRASNASGPSKRPPRKSARPSGSNATTNSINANQAAPQEGLQE